jgi:hypothetical protein
VEEGKGAAKETAKETIERIQTEVTEYTNLLKGKVVAIGGGASAMKFVLRKETREPKD